MIPKNPKCSRCSKVVSRKDIKRISKEWVCCDCVIKSRRENREHLKREVLGIRKRGDLEKEWAERRRNEPPKIKGEKTKVYSKQLHFYLTLEEKRILFKKYIKMGLCEEEASDRISRDVKHLKELVERLKVRKIISDADIESRFKEEFAKLVSGYPQVKGGLKEMQ